MPFAFLNPWLLLGLPATSIPIIIHLAQRRKFKIVQWGAMEFLLRSEAKTTRKRKIQNLILLILRTLMILLIVLAASRPLLKGAAFAGMVGRERTHAVIILDDSFSMGATSGDVTAFERAKKAVMEVLALLKAGDAVTFIRASDPPRVVENPNYFPQLVKQSIQDTPLSTRATNYVGALALANQVLDLVPLYIVKVPPASDQNAAVTAVEFPRGLVDTLGVTRLVASVKNWSTSDLHHVTAELVVDGRTIDRRTLALKGKSEEFIEFRHRFERPGLHHGFVKISKDVLELDNAFYFHTRVRDQLKVLCVDGWDEEEGASRFFQTALNPTGKTYMMVKAIRSDHFSSYLDQLPEYQVVVLANVPRLGAREADRLQNYVRQGGAVFIALGDAVDRLSYNGLLHQRGEGFLPGQLGTVKGDPRTRTIRTAPTVIKHDHPMMKIFSEAELADLKSVTVHAYTALELDNHPDVSVMASLKDGGVLMAEKRVGKGRVIVWTSSLDDAWNDLPTIQHLMYVPLMNQTVSYLAAGPAEPLVVGQPIIKKLSFREYPFQGQLPVIILPNDEHKTAAMTSEEGGYLVRYDKTDLPGSYVLTRQGGDAAGALERFSVNVDTSESNLDTLDETRLQALFPGATFRFLANEERIRDLLVQERIGVELWKPLLKLLLIIGLVEFILAHVFSHQLRAQPVRAKGSAS